MYDNDFINPWKEVTVQPSEPETTTTLITTARPTTVAPTIPSSTTNADGLIYDIDVRFGQ